LLDPTKPALRPAHLATSAFNHLDQHVSSPGIRACSLLLS